MEVGLTAKVEPEVDERAAEREAGKLQEHVDEATNEVGVGLDMDDISDRLEFMREQGEEFSEVTQEAKENVGLMANSFEGPLGGFDQMAGEGGFAQDVMFNQQPPQMGGAALGPDQAAGGQGQQGGMLSNVMGGLQEKFSQFGQSMAGMVAQTRSLTGLMSQIGNLLMNKGGKMVLVGLGLVLLSRLVSSATNASPLLGSAVDIFKLAMKLMFRPFGRALGKFFLPMAVAMLRFAKEFNTVFNNQGFWGAMGFLLKEIFFGAIDFLLGNLDNIFRFAAFASLFNIIFKRLSSVITKRIGWLGRFLIKRIPGVGLFIKMFKGISKLGAIFRGAGRWIGRGLMWVFKKLGWKGIAKILARFIPRIAGSFVPILNIILWLDLLFELLFGWSPIFDGLLPAVFGLLKWAFGAIVDILKLVLNNLGLIFKMFVLPFLPLIITFKLMAMLLFAIWDFFESNLGPTLSDIGSALDNIPTSMGDVQGAVANFELSDIFGFAGVGLSVLFPFAGVGLGALFFFTDTSLSDLFNFVGAGLGDLFDFVGADLGDLFSFENVALAALFPFIGTAGLLAVIFPFKGVNLTELFGGVWSSLSSFLGDLFGGVFSNPGAFIAMLFPAIGSAAFLLNKVFPDVSVGDMKDWIMDTGGDVANWLEKNLEGTQNTFGGQETVSPRTQDAKGGDIPSNMFPEMGLSEDWEFTSPAEMDSGIPDPSGFSNAQQYFNSLSLDVSIADVLKEYGYDSIDAFAQEEFATGGIVTDSVLGLIGEGRESEAVLPLSRLQSLLDMSASNAVGGMPSPGSSLTQPGPSGAGASADISLSVDTEASPSEIASAIESELGGRFDDINRELQSVASEISNMDMGDITITADGKVLAKVTEEGDDKYGKTKEVLK